MSLINDALRRARQEAAEREAREKGLPQPVFPPPRRRLPSLPPAGVLMVVGLGALLIGVLVAVLAVRPGTRSNARDATVTVTPSSSPRDPQGPAAPTTAGPAPSASPHHVGDERRAGIAPPAATPPPDASAAPPPAPPVTPRPATTTPPPPAAPAPAAPRSTPARREFRGEATLGGTTLRLDYLVYRPSDPFAEINGVELHEGWEIEGYTVVRIQTDRVVLEGPEGKVVLRAR